MNHCSIYKQLILNPSGNIVFVIRQNVKGYVILSFIIFLNKYLLFFRMWLYTTLLGTLLCTQFSNNVEARTKKSKSVTTLLEAKWEVTPLVLEVAEYLADENVDFYWSFIDSISNLSPPLVEIGIYVLQRP